MDSSYPVKEYFNPKQYKNKIYKILETKEADRKLKENSIIERKKLLILKSLMKEINGENNGGSKNY